VAAVTWRGIATAPLTAIVPVVLLGTDEAGNTHICAILQPNPPQAVSTDDAARVRFNDPLNVTELAEAKLPLPPTNTTSVWPAVTV
jgi:hypothetical protein